MAKADPGPGGGSTPHLIDVITGSIYTWLRVYSRSDSYPGLSFGQEVSSDCPVFASQEFIRGAELTKNHWVFHTWATLTTCNKCLCLAREDEVAQTTAHLQMASQGIFSAFSHNNQLDDNFNSIARLSPVIRPLVLQAGCMCRECRFWYQAFQSNYKRPMGHIVYLRKQFKSINTYDFTITLIQRRKNILFTIL